MISRSPRPGVTWRLCQRADSNRVGPGAGRGGGGTKILPPIQFLGNGSGSASPRDHPREEGGSDKSPRLVARDRSGEDTFPEHAAGVTVPNVGSGESLMLHLVLETQQQSVLSWAAQELKG